MGQEHWQLSHFLISFSRLTEHVAEALGHERWAKSIGSYLLFYFSHLLVAMKHWAINVRP
jgi:hypothetical protein